MVGGQPGCVPTDAIWELWVELSPSPASTPVSQVLLETGGVGGGTQRAQAEWTSVPHFCPPQKELPAPQSWPWRQTALHSKPSSASYKLCDLQLIRKEKVPLSRPLPCRTAVRTRQSEAGMSQHRADTLYAHDNARGCPLPMASPPGPSPVLPRSPSSAQTPPEALPGLSFVSLPCGSGSLSFSPALGNFP